MKSKELLGLFIILAIAQVSYSQSTGKNAFNYRIEKVDSVIGKTFPVFTANMDSRKVSNDLLRNKVVLINFWFEGCHPCMSEMEALTELYDSLKNNKNFLFISFTWDNPETIKRVKEKYAINFGIVSTSEAECERLNFGSGYPTSLILDRTGTIKYLHNGGFVEKEKAREFVIRELLEEVRKVLNY